jgi:Protein of unknown function (DUF2911)
MVRKRVAVYALFIIAFAAASLAQQDDQTVASCTLDDGKQVSIRYNPVTTKSDKPVNGKAWAPGGEPMTLFSEVQLSFAGATIAPGAYTIYPFPGKSWALAINKNVAAHSAYDEKQDVARGPIETDPVTEPSDTLEVAFAHVGDKCTLRIYFGKAACFAPFGTKE